MTNEQKDGPKLVVGVGASAGGLEAFKSLMSALPSDSGMAFVLVQHLAPRHVSLLPDLLAPCTDMPVREVDEGVELEANTVYIIRPDKTLAIRDGNIELTEPTFHRGVRLTVDHLFRSLAREYGPRAVGIVLSGAGGDGSSGIRDIRATGGLVIAQKPEASGQAGMPQSAIDTGVVDLVLDISEMPAALTRFESLPPQARFGCCEEAAGGQNRDGKEGDGRASSVKRLSDDYINRLATILQARTRFDLRVYKASTIERRVLRRLGLSGFGELEPYVEHLRTNPSEQQTLIRDLLISVTEFFRDQAAFEALRQIVVEPLVTQAAPGDTLRAWVPGCATGEEAYSIAMEFLDAIDAQNKRITVQIFATDVDTDALAVGRSAMYPLSIADQVSQRRLNRYFKFFEGRGYQARPQLRDVVSFAAHDLTKDPPFSRMQLVSCRNVLIYLTPEAQKHVFGVLHFALQSEGYLFLGTAESTGSQRELFSTLSKAQRIYRKAGASRPVRVSHTRTRNMVERMSHVGSALSYEDSASVSGSDSARRAVVEAFCPPTLVVSKDGTVIFSHGELEPYVRFPQGDHPRFELGSILRPEIATRARSALYKCRRDKAAVTAHSSVTDSSQQIRIEARPAFELGDGAVILAFEKRAGQQRHGVEVGAEDAEHEAVIDQLEKELHATREDLRSTVEELETSNEELRSSNEESMSMNEELQSTNEELEATTEELRSLNEELTTVNNQLREKVEQVERAHDDLNNFFASTKIATVFLDDGFRINRFTPSARELLNIDEADIGRRVSDIARDLLQVELVQEATEVLEHLNSSSREIETDDGKWVSRQVLPYRTEKRQIEGVVVTFVDITDLKRATERLALRERQQSVIARMGLNALRSRDLEAFMDHVVAEVQQTLETDYCKILELQPGGDRLFLRAGVGWQAGLVGSAHVDTGRNSQAGYTLQSSDPVCVDNLAKDKRFSGPALLTDHGVVSGMSCVIRDGGQPYGVLGAHTREPRKFTQEDTNFLQAVAAVLNSAISRQQVRLRIDLELVVAHALAEQSELEDGLSSLLERLAKKVSASVAELWWADANKNELTRAQLWVETPSQRERVGEAFPERCVESGEGLVGHVHANASSVWATNLGDPQLFVRPDGAKILGLATGFALPIRAGNDALGVIALFSPNRLFADEVLLGSLDAIGRSIGDFVRRATFEERHRRLAAITESSHDAIISYRLDGTVTEWLSGAERLFGYSTAEMVGGPVERIVPDERRSELWAINARIQNGEVVEPFETIRIRKDGSSVPVSIRSSPVKLATGEIIGISSTDRDISAQKETEQRLIDADQQKDEFLAMLGHELRNPLAAIRSATDLFKLTGENGPQLNRIQGILERQSAHMAKLLDGLLDVSRIIRGKIRLQPVVLDLSTLCREVVSDADGRLRHQDLTFERAISADPVWVKADPVRLRQVTDNLLSNAMKFTPDGGRITVELSRDETHAVLVVRDTGVGIEPEVLPRIFEVFRQSGQNLDRAHGGLGLGLALVKALVEMHGGTVEAQSAGPGKGSEFRVRLPVTNEGPVEDTPEQEASGPLRILLIEDNRDTAEMLKEVLELSGHEVKVAHTAKQGIAMAQNNELDVVLCDIGLPDGMSGYDVAEALRGERRAKALRLIALTGYGRPEIKERCRNAGFDAHITKPVDLASLFRLLREARAG